MSAPPRIAMLSGNDALSDSRVMKSLRAAAGAGYDAVALGICRGESVRQEVFEWGGRVVVQPVTVRYEAWRRYGRPHFFYDETDYGIGRNYARHLYQSRTAEADRAFRDAGRRPSVAARRPTPAAVRLARAAHGLAVRGWVRLRSWRARAEVRRESWDEARLEAWRRRRFAWLGLAPWRANWRGALPEAVDRAMALARPLDELAPDIVHVHDVYMMHVAA
ncbi:MAG: hypothetical protein LBD51_07690, partial [Bifidobacteriaceae bacterium]|nr:hypothetical protein [Bifidobacteriaceae bacterium]